MTHWTLTTKDLYLLVKMLGGKVLIGISYPFPEHRIDEMEKEWERTFKKLHKLELVDYIDGELKFKDQFIRAMWVLAKTNLVAEIVTDDKKQSLFYFSDDSVIECMKVNEAEFSVVVHHSPDWTWRQIIIPRMLMGIENLSTRMDERLLIIPNDYKRYSKDGGIYNIEQVAANNELEQDSLLVKQLNRSLQSKVHTNRLMMFYQMNNNWSIEGAHVLSSPSFNWTLRMINEDGIEWLEAKQASGKRLMREILGVMERVKEMQSV
ncbi:hypothetical protein ACFOUV_15860 [Oceanobacillus longus]|uniref:Uncharacterized protein n=1 Tax=Oceanobacillus longus TaxID=930120 RepID=A0ABV8H355_9BACI